MSEFGHRASIGGGVCLDSWGAGPFILHANGKSWRFEDSDRFGPWFCRRDGSEAKNQMPSRQFWDAHFAWRKQGRRLEADGITCIWEPLRPTIVRITKGELVVVQSGDPNGKTLTEDGRELDFERVEIRVRRA